MKPDPVRCPVERTGSRCTRLAGHPSAHRFHDPDAAALWTALAAARRNKTHELVERLRRALGWTWALRAIVLEVDCSCCGRRMRFCRCTEDCWDNPRQCAGEPAEPEQRSATA